jgi:fucose permease
MKSKENPTSSRFELVPVLFLMFLFVLNFLPRIILAPLLVTIEKELHLGHQEVGVFFLLISSGYCLTLLLSGFVSSRLSHKTCIVLSTLAVGMALLWISGSSTLKGMRLGLITGMCRHSIPPELPPHRSGESSIWEGAGHP